MAAGWWRDRLLKGDGNTDVGDPHLTSLQVRGRKSAGLPDPEKVEAFYQDLVERLRDAWSKRRENGMEDRDLPFCIYLSVDYEPQGILCDLAKKHGIPGVCFPIKTKMTFRGWSFEVGDSPRTPFKGEDISILELGSPEHFHRCCLLRPDAFPLTFPYQEREERFREFGQDAGTFLDQLTEEELTQFRRYSGYFRSYEYERDTNPAGSLDNKYDKFLLKWEILAYRQMQREMVEGIPLPVTRAAQI